MKRKVPKAYFLIFFSILALMSIPRQSTEKLQGITVATLTPFWQQLLNIKSLFSTYDEGENSPFNASYEIIEKLRLENALLHEEILHLKDLMMQELRLINRMNAFLNDDEPPFSTKTLKTRHILELKKLLNVHLEAIPARIIFRSPDSWNSSFWINVGTETNESLGNFTIAKNSPVLLGTSVIGVIDYVGKRQARVRLITDSGLTPSIRAVRGGIQNKILDEKINATLEILKKTPHALDSDEHQGELISQLESASNHLSYEEKTNYLAKGELYGSSKPLWRTQRHHLKGIGFNYDFADGEGPARDLRNGQHALQDPHELTIPIVKKGDLLITTGMDGVFPAGLMVAEVTQVHPLKEGDYYYELDALPVVGNFDDLSLVFVIPPVPYDPDELPSPFEWKHL